MAYNVLKGNVQFINSDTGSIESMVDNYSNQAVSGVKTFSSPITASGFFDSTGGGSAIVSSPISSISNAADERIAIFSSADTVEGKTGLTYNDTVLAVTGNISASANISGSEFYGSGVGLTGLPAASITGQVNAANVNFGNGLNNVGGALTISASNSSISIDSDGIAVNAAGNTSGLKLGGSGIRVDPNRATTKGSLTGNDEFLIADSADSNNLKKATVTVLEGHMNNTLTFAKVGGSDEQIFFNNGGSNTLGTDSTFTFNDTTKVVRVSDLTASSNISASAFYGNGNFLTSLNATTLVGNVSAANINIGDGLFNDSNALAVSASFGLIATAQGLEVTASATSGLDVGPSLGGLVISPSRTTTKGSPVINDVIILGDSADSNKVKNTTLSNIISLVEQNGAGGANTQVQFNNSNAFAGSSNFTFNSATNTLAVSSISSSLNISASAFYGDGSNLLNAGLISNVRTSATHLTASATDEFIVMNNPQPATASLPSINSLSGNRYTIKRTGNADVQVSCSAGNKIEGFLDTVDLVTKGDFVSLISDGGNSWLIVGKSGSF